MSGATKEKVEVSIDYITGQGNKNLVTIAAEAQAKSGHDILAMPTAPMPERAPAAGSDWQWTSTICTC
jgi:hypothetical protein